LVFSWLGFSSPAVAVQPSDNPSPPASSNAPGQIKKASPTSTPTPTPIPAPTRAHSGPIQTTTPAPTNPPAPEPVNPITAARKTIENIPVPVAATFPYLLFGLLLAVTAVFAWQIRVEIARINSYI